MEKLSRLEALLLTAVLENCADQLAILGYIMPVSHEGKTDTSHIKSQKTKEITDTQNVLDIKYQELSSARQGRGETVTSKSWKSTECKQQLANSEDPKRAHHISTRAMKPSALSADDLRKIQADRQHVSDVITATVKKMEESGTFDSLIEANGREKAKKSNLNDILIREEEGKKEIKSLQKQLQDVKKETEIELQVLWSTHTHTLLCVYTGEMYQTTSVESRRSVMVLGPRQPPQQLSRTQSYCNRAKPGTIRCHPVQSLAMKMDITNHHSG